MATVGGKGVQLDLLVRQGATAGPFDLTITNEVDDTPVDLTGVTVRGQIRKTPSSVAEISAVVTYTNRVAGQVAFEFSAEDTAGLTASDTDEFEPASLYVWDLEMQDASGRVIALLFGDVNVFREVTKP